MHVVLHLLNMEIFHKTVSGTINASLHDGNGFNLSTMMLLHHSEENIGLEEIAPAFGVFIHSGLQDRNITGQVQHVGVKAYIICTDTHTETQTHTHAH